MDWQAVESTSVSKVAYSVTTRVLGIEFLRSGRYEYLDVSVEEHAALMRAESKGLHVNRFIKGKHPYRRCSRVAP